MIRATLLHSSHKKERKDDKIVSCTRDSVVSGISKPLADVLESQQDQIVSQRVNLATYSALSTKSLLPVDDA
jgi:hypothetical protein